MKVFNGLLSAALALSLYVCDAQTDTAFKQASSDEFKSVSNDEFSSANSDEFLTVSADEFAATDSTINTSASCIAESTNSIMTPVLQWNIYIVLFTVLAGIFVRFKSTRKLRVFFLLASIFILGFYKSPCFVCPVNAVQNTIMFVAGFDIKWTFILLLPALLIVTYIFGRVYCGWICHLGALQEFLYLTPGFKMLQSPKSQKVLKLMRYALLLVLIVQLIALGYKYWCRIDPFVNIFGFQAFADAVFGGTVFDLEFIIMITLVLLLLISSVLIHRPFCRAACPMGLLLGLVSRIPGASVIGLNKQCSSCKSCNTACEIKAIVRHDKFSVLDNTECIACGKCIDACNKNGLSFLRKSKNHPAIMQCKTQCDVEI